MPHTKKAPAFAADAKTVYICNSSLIVGSTCRDVHMQTNPAGLSENESHLLQIFNQLDLAHKLDFLGKALQYEALCSGRTTPDMSNICWTAAR